MDGLSGASSVIAVGSIAIQLAENIKKIVEFGRAVEHAPTRICALFHDLEVLESAITQIHRTNSRVTFDSVNEAVLKNCEKKISALQKTIQPAILNLKSNKLRCRKWSAFKITLKEEEILTLQKSIEEAKSTLQLVQNNSLLELLFSTVHSQSKAVVSIETLTSVVQKSLAQKSGFETGRMHIHHLNEACSEACTPGFQNNLLSGATAAVEEITSLADLKDLTTSSDYIAKKPCRSFDFQTWQYSSLWSFDVTTPFVGVHTQSRTYELRTVRASEVRKTSTTDVTCVVYPKAGGKLLGMSHGILLSAKSTLGWQFTIQPFRAVAEDSLIFEFCRKGNLDGVKTLFERGEASPWDRDPAGRTPLWVASQFLQLDVAKLLLNEGADPHARSWRSNYQPIFAIIYCQAVEIDSKLAMINLLQSYQRDYDDDTTLSIIGLSMRDWRPQKACKMPWAQRCDAMLKLLSALMPTWHFADSIRVKVIFGAVLFGYEQEVLRWILRNTKVALDGSPEYSIIHEAIHHRLPERDLCSMKLIVEKTKNPHLCAKKGYLQPGLETPTMLAMRDMNVFLLWLQVLRELSYDIQQFVHRELEEGPLRESGWTEDSLAYLFGIEIPPDPHTGPILFGYPSCQRCGRDGKTHITKLVVDLKWRRQLRDLRLRFSNKLSDTVGMLASETYEVRDTNHSKIVRNCSNTEYAKRNHQGDLPSAPTNQEEWPTKLPSRSLPYRIVCSDVCLDGISVASVFDNDSYDEPDFPLYRNEDSSVSKEIRETSELNSPAVVMKESCPTDHMPGAFND